MANTSISAAFERFWQHVTVALGKKSDIDHSHEGFGFNNTIGGKGYKIIAASQATTADDGTVTGTYTLRTTEGLEVGMEYSARLQAAAYKAGKIIAIDGNDVTVDGYKYMALKDVEDDFENHIIENYLTIVDRPDLGDIEVGFGAFSAGYNNISQDRATTTVGRGNRGTGQYGFAGGHSNRVGFAAFAYGRDSEALGDQSATLGNELITRVSNQVVVGTGNSEVADARFIVGNGTAEDRSNAFVVTQDGKAMVQDGTLTTKEYVDRTFSRADMSKDHRYFKDMTELDSFVNELAESIPCSTLKQQSCTVKTDDTSTNGIITILTSRDWTGTVVPFAKFECPDKTLYKEGYVSSIDTSKGEISLTELFDTYTEGASTPWSTKSTGNGEGSWDVEPNNFRLHLTRTDTSKANGPAVFYNPYLKVANWNDFILETHIDFGQKQNRWFKLHFRTTMKSGSNEPKSGYYLYFFFIGNTYYVRLYRTNDNVLIGEESISSSYVTGDTPVELLCIGNSFTITIPSKSGGYPWKYRFVDTDIEKAILTGGTIGFQGTLYDFSVYSVVINSFDNVSNIYTYGWNDWTNYSILNAYSVNTSSQFDSCIFEIAKAQKDNSIEHISIYYGSEPHSITIHKLNSSNIFVEDIFEASNDIDGWSGYYKRVKSFTAGLWGSWQWESPPTHPDTPYLTTTKYDGVSEYRMLVDFGALPNAASKAKILKDNSRYINIVKVTGIKGIATCESKSFEFPVLDEISNDVVAKASIEPLGDNWMLKVITTKDLTAYNAKFIITYTDTYSKEGD
jgi:hypothetical protein